MSPIRIPANELKRMVDAYHVMVSAKAAFEDTVADYTETAGVNLQAVKKAVKAYAEAEEDPPAGSKFFSNSSIQFRLALGLFPHLMDVDPETGEALSGELSRVVEETERGGV